MQLTDKILIHRQPRTVVFGIGCSRQCAADYAQSGRKRALLVTAPPTLLLAETLAADLRAAGVDVAVWSGVDREPTVSLFAEGLAAARRHKCDGVLGLGGGSALDVAKLVAALAESRQTVTDVWGIGKLESRSLYLACLPTTAGTGSEVSTNAILLDEAEGLKKGVVSPHLVPDAAYVDPALTFSVPPPVTAATGMDALTHCIEAYANVNAHPMTDLLALEGVRLIGSNLRHVVANGLDAAGRSAVALGSVYGGLCLGSANTGAVHALAYPLGGEYHVPHGVANAVLLPHVLRFNLQAAPERYAQVAAALGVAVEPDTVAMARKGVERLAELSRACGIPQSLSDLGVPRSAVESMARSAMTVTRLLKNNVRPLTETDAVGIYGEAFQ
ncbi:MAG: iron-containing alcohol dehydrogenase [Lentisphaerae bacterium]|nr:iron-containing alcohol dehydrogenase [Lentisphaerota bacterium]